ncbi:UDP-glucose:glycoprotein glucosyltransferase 1 [Thecamonas trahens ATCC 50062]|uniref:UDP-glucose:glycoprotein glucosyltransferase 1 n=1 Tax=Thecamonas trahens ATCC 50062 TaxID=461836 RepID=A0A0L0DQA5_THETB|nr:UDP-glucose:glycoprotein glucosyltransferase 1 [Thecamonas trahens ATCC 50062]KNC54206.1 UDP-glucose:glycoprotein glucosyltransferase 1 [Thecamonas trahens ATCC 50062]|eukprot:XP_013753846.1 UDP-glucose:glycoprotein glucosyltransferase 1 [Thecamonas trahens ATCC 50062]
MRYLLAVVAACLLAAVVVEAQVRVAMRPRWAPTSVLQEASEFARTWGEPGLAFVDAVANHCPKCAHVVTDVQVVEALSASEAYGLAGRADLLRMALNVGAHAPAVEAARQVAALLADEACSSVSDGLILVAGEKVFCSEAAIDTGLADGSLVAAAGAGGLEELPMIRDALAAELLAVAAGTAPKAIMFGVLGTRTVSRVWLELRLALGDELAFGHGVASGGQEPSRLAGYGVELAIKSTEYKVVDDSSDEENDEGETVDADAPLPSLPGLDVTKLVERMPDEEAALRAAGVAFGNAAEIKPLKKWQLRDLGFKAAQAVVDASDPLAELARISQNLPSLASWLARKKNSAAGLHREVRETAAVAGAGSTALVVNGRVVDVSSTSIFQLYTLVGEELVLADKLRSLGLAPEHVAAVASAASPNQGASGDSVRVAVTEVKHIAYLNNLARDEQYASWPASIAVITQPTYGFHRVRRNVVTLLYVMDPSSPASLGVVFQLMQFHSGDAPLRFGLVLRPGPSDLSSRLVRGLLHVRGEGGSALMWQVLGGVAMRARGGVPLEEHFDAALSAVANWDGPITLADILASEAGDELADELAELAAYHASINIPANTFVINSRVVPNEGALQSVVASALRDELTRLAALVVAGKVNDKVNVFKYVNTEPDVLSSYSRLAVPSADAPLRVVALDPSKVGLAIGAWHGAEAAPVSILVVARDDGSAQCVVDKLAAYAVSELAHSGKFRYARLGVEAWASAAGDGDDAELVVVVNGRVIAMAASTACDELALGDLELMVKLEMESRVGLLLEGEAELASAGLRGRNKADVLMYASSLVFASARAADEARPVGAIRSLERAAGGVVVGPEAGATIRAIAVVNPLSEAAQELAPVLALLRESVGARVVVRLNPDPALSELPLKRFYRAALAPALVFDGQGARQQAQAVFSGLPTQFLLTLGVSTPDAWLVQPVAAKHDLDNLQLGALRRGDEVAAEFELSELLVEGRAYQVAPVGPPTGLELVLGTPREAVVEDTLVMANLGYFQLKAQPGVWQLQLKPERPSSEMYSMLNTTDYGLLKERSKAEFDELVDEARLADGTGRVVAVTSFDGASVTMLVAKKPGYEEKSLLAAHAEVADSGLSSVWSSLTGSRGGSKSDVINVFSVASGHLYERFLAVMMRSVMSSTQSKVKFWILRQFLSPSFKEALPKLAADLGFDYQLIAYQWPRWLLGQSEKQRLIWGYKILFLDVLFPLEVDRLVFVDADQTVRADLLELHTMDLEGKPYGFTPMCESNPDTQGFMFWKQGYWSSHMKGKPYVISALFVVDLTRFRAMSAGDTLRATYQSLARDPNSLSNLDQDLPNYLAPGQLPMHYLPQEWLYCEAWCEDGTGKLLDAAKSIDLCNSPLTKEPKLDMAGRVVAEWHDFDDANRALLRSPPSPSPGDSDVRHDEL